MTFGVVVIGRNEGERLVRCFDSLGGVPCVYVDSGSTDDSIENAAQKGVTTHQLDLSRPFTAARARNEGFQRLDELVDDLEFVMFVDGDCEITSNWFSDGLRAIRLDDKVVAVCGRRRERYPTKSVYNQMCDIEWDTPIGEAKSCGGDAIYRASAFRQIAGFNESFIAGEEPELCFRLRKVGYRILRIDSEMTWHDAAILHFRQWWKRTERSGHAYYLGFKAHGLDASEAFRQKELRSIVFWGSIPLLGVILSFALLSVWPLFVVLFLYVAQAVKVSRYMKTVRGIGVGIAVKYGLFTLIGKVPQLLGVVKAWFKLRLGKDMHLVEYK